MNINIKRKEDRKPIAYVSGDSLFVPSDQTHTGQWMQIKNGCAVLGKAWGEAYLKMHMPSLEEVYEGDTIELTFKGVVR